MTKRFTPPTPLLSRKAQAERVEAIQAARVRSRGVVQARKARQAQIRGDALSQAHRMLEAETGIPWRVGRAQPVRYWDERWDLSAGRSKASYEEIHEWLYRLQTNRTTAGYLGSRSISIMVTVRDGKERLTFTAASAASFLRAMDEMDEKLQVWAERYGRDEDEDGYSRVEEVTVLLRRRGVHKQWRSVVAGRAAERESRRLRAGSRR